MLKRILMASMVLLLANSAFAATNTPTTLPASATFDGEAPAPKEWLSLWYRRPAAQWTEALPLGNGRQGAMIFGGVPEEVICLNESTFWAGGPYDPSNAGALAALPQVRQLIFDGKFAEAQRMANAQMMGTPQREMAYQPIGDLLLSFPGITQVQNYRRDLNLATAVASVQYTSNGVTFTREAFLSHPANVLVMRLTADRPGQLNFKLGIRSEQPNKHISAEGTDTLLLAGTNADYHGIKSALTFQTRIRIVPKGGTLTAGDTLNLADADAATIYLASATSYKKYDDVTGDPAALTTALVAKASTQSYDDLLQAHLKDYQSLFSRVSLDLGGATLDAAKRPTFERISDFSKSPTIADPQLATLYFQYARYLLIGSSRAGAGTASGVVMPGDQPANLQGLWNDLTQPPWECKFTININTEMNYWPVDTTNLGECVDPLLAMVEDLSKTGTRTAKVMYNARGWVAHHNTDVWRASAPCDAAQYGMWPCSNAWLCNTLHDHYRFTGDRQFLARLYPLMKGASEFFFDTLVEEPKHHWLVTSPSMSPENPHHHEGTDIMTCDGPTIDMQLLRDLFAHSIEASQILGVDEDFRKQAVATRARLAPNQIGAAGQLQEWLEDWDLQAPQPHNRHMSHLYGFYPGTDISYEHDKELTAAVKKSLELRGDDATGWGLGWRMNAWARLHDGDHAAKILQKLLVFARPNPPAKDRAGAYANLFDAHPPFQIDGNFGGATGIGEMLLQSQEIVDGKPLIELLPALPAAFPTGSASGLRARGGYEVSLRWADGKLIAAKIVASDNAQPALVRYNGKTSDLGISAGQTRTFVSTP